MFDPKKNSQTNNTNDKISQKNSKSELGTIESK